MTDKIQIEYVHVNTGVQLLVDVIKKRQGGVRFNFSFRDSRGFDSTWAYSEIDRFDQWIRNPVGHGPEGWLPVGSQDNS